MTRRARIEPAMPAATKKLRCAVYTRKSTDEGLEKEFNTLDAQRDACEAYITSQRAEGWVLVRDRYDDGGFSGGTLERPALQRLLRDIQANLVDVIVVYKIDRLSRSLMDFAKLVEVMDAHSTPARQEDRRDADDGWRGAGHDARRPSAGEGAGSGVPVSADAGRRALCLDHRIGSRREAGPGISRQSAKVNASRPRYHRERARWPAARRRVTSCAHGAVPHRMGSTARPAVVAISASTQSANRRTRRPRWAPCMTK